MNQLWGWTATDAFGRSQNYQVYGPDVTEAQMRDHLAKHFRNVTLTNLKRLEDGQFSPATGEIESHTYDYGILDGYYRSKGMTPYTDMLRRKSGTIQSTAIQRRPLIRTLLPRSPILRTN